MQNTSRNNNKFCGQAWWVLMTKHILKKILSNTIINKKTNITNKIKYIIQTNILHALAINSEH
jgi:hypothetical protein